jgi:hypothetical protein
VQGIRDVAQLNHLWHVVTIIACGSHVNASIRGKLHHGRGRSPTIKLGIEETVF